MSESVFNIGPGELVVILLLALIIFGPGKLPEVGRALGRTVNEFKRATSQEGEARPQVAHEEAPRPSNPAQAPAAGPSPAASASTPAAALKDGHDAAGPGGPDDPKAAEGGRNA